MPPTKCGHLADDEDRFHQCGDASEHPVTGGTQMGPSVYSHKGRHTERSGRDWRSLDSNNRDHLSAAPPRAQDVVASEDKRILMSRSGRGGLEGHPTVPNTETKPEEIAEARLLVALSVSATPKRSPDPRQVVSACAPSVWHSAY